MKYIIGLVGMLLPVLSIGQSPQIKPLSIGDTVPDIVFNNIINYKDTKAKLSDFKGELILLDFWSTRCMACIKGFPKMDSLQRKYKALQVLLVNTKSRLSGDDEKKIKKTLNNLKQRTGQDINLPIVCGNSILDSLFPVIYIPQVVWIKNNKVIAITGSEEVNHKNIETALKSEYLKVHFKKDLASFDTKIPLFIEGNGGKGEQMLYRSLLAKYTEGIGSSSGYRITDDKITGVYYLNHSLLSLIKKGYSSMSFPANRIIIESDNENFKEENTEEFKYSHSYCYELILPPSNEAQVKEYIRQDMEKYFRITVCRDIRKMKCLVLYKKNDCEYAFTRSSQRGFDIEADSKKKYIHNRSLTDAIRLLNKYINYPLIGESNVSTNISIDLPFDLNDIRELQKSFEKVGFDLKEEEREVEVAVIADL